MENLMSGGNGYVAFILILLIGIYFGTYVVFPNNIFHRFLIKWTYKIFFEGLKGGRQRWQKN